TEDFEFRAGPVFTQVLLADEINRATPKTQAALLEAMEERQVTVDGETKPLPHPFVVMATQNPIEYAGTFPLPEAQLDRFMMRVRAPGRRQRARGTGPCASPDPPAQRRDAGPDDAQDPRPAAGTGARAAADR